MARCQICGKEHHALCHKCPHFGNPLLVDLPWEEHPCSACTDDMIEAAKCDSRAQGHGRGIRLDSVAPSLVACPPVLPWDDGETPVKEGFLAIAREAISALLELPPREYVTLIEAARRTKDGMPRTLVQIKAATDRILLESVTIQMVSIRLRAARDKLRRHHEKLKAGEAAKDDGKDTRKDSEKKKTEPGVAPVEKRPIRKPKRKAKEKVLHP